MLTLNPGSSCDVCAEEYGPHCLPHCIPCGHVLCRNCCASIVEKTSSRLSPVCPFCRTNFTGDSIRLIRTDFMSGSGYSTPRFVPGTNDGSDEEMISDAFSRKAERMLMTEGGCSRSRVTARRLEDKVAKVAAKKCSVEEVSTLHNELQEWLTSDPVPSEKMSSLHLSAALLRAILMNHFAHSEASKNAKNVEANLKGKLDDMEMNIGKLEAELQRQRLAYQTKSQECTTLRTELSRLKALNSISGGTAATTTTTASAVAAANDARRQASVSPPPSISSVSTPPRPSTAQPSQNQPAVTPLSRFTSTHSRSASLSNSSLRPTTPSPASLRSYTPAPAPTRSYTPAPARSKTPGPTSHYHSSYQHAPPVPPVPPATPTPTSSSRTRRMSLSSPYASSTSSSASSTPQKIVRSTSEEKPDGHNYHERWNPPATASLSRSRFGSISSSSRYAM